jgi:hypothetical protein
MWSVKLEYFISHKTRHNSSLFNEFVCKLDFFWNEWATSTKKAQFTQERDEYNAFLFNELLKSSKSLKIFKISLTFRFDKLTFIKIRSHRRKFSNSDSVEQKNYLNVSQI